MLGITKIAHQRQIKQRKDEWIILGDETGQLREFIPEQRQDRVKAG